MLPAFPVSSTSCGCGASVIVEHVLRPRPPLVRSRNHARRAVLACEVVEQPDGVADPIPFVVGDGRHVHVKGLPDVRRRIRRSGIQAAQLDPGPEDVPNVVEQPRQHDRASEDLAFVDEVRQPMGVLFRAEFLAGAVAFLVEQLADALPQPVQEVRVDPALEHHVSVLVEMPLFLLGHGCHRLPVE